MKTSWKKSKSGTLTPSTDLSSCGFRFFVAHQGAMCGFLGALFFTHWDPFLSLMVVVNVPWVSKKLINWEVQPLGSLKDLMGFMVVKVHFDVFVFLLQKKHDKQQDGIGMMARC